MNTRLIAYLRKLGLDANASDEQAWEFYNGLRGLQASIASALNYSESDHAARTNCDLMIRALGYNPENPSEELSRQEPQRQQVGSDGASANGDLEAARAEGAQRERSRVQAIREYAVIAGTPQELIDTLVADVGITADAARQRIFEDHQARTRASVPADRPNVPAAHSRNSVTGATLQVLEAAMLHRSGIDPSQGWVGNDNGMPVRRSNPELANVAEQAWQYRTCSMEDFLRMAARVDGVTLPNGRNGLLEAYLRSGFSTQSLSNIFTTNINSQLLAAYEVAPDSTTGGWIREADVADFKTNDRIRLVQGGAMVKLPRGKEADHATHEDVVESYRIARYAKQFVMDDQDIVDDTFGAANEFAPADLGVAARQLRPDLVYSILIGNPVMRDSVTLFHTASHGNLATSAGLATAGKLSAGRAAMRLQREGVRNLNLMPEFLIVPPTLEDDADALMNSRLLVSTDAAKTPANNPNYQKLTVVPEPRLENGVVDPTSPSTTHAGANNDWFLAARAGSHTIEVGYLRGTGRVPQVRPFVLTQGRWGLGWDVKMDIGAKALDWRGLYKGEG